MKKHHTHKTDRINGERFVSREALIQYLNYALDEVASYDEESAAYLRMAILQLSESTSPPTGMDAAKHS